MTADDDAVTDDVVFGRVQACLRNLVGGSGHLASYDLVRESFAVTATRDVDDGGIEYAFDVLGARVSEFTAIAGDDDGRTSDDGGGTNEDEGGRTAVDDPDLEALSGAIVLDEAGGLAVDDEGRVRLTPWRTLDPSLWSNPDGDDGLDELLAGLEREDV